jgi:predicted XRE-type DNA-binding protein
MQHNNPSDDAEVTFEHSSGNVFADLGLENSDELLVKADLAHAVMAIVRAHGWAQSEAADRTGLTQPDVSLLGRMKLDRFSQERLQTVLRRLGMDVEIILHPRENGGIGTLKVRELA